MSNIHVHECTSKPKHQTQIKAQLHAYYLCTHIQTRLHSSQSTANAVICTCTCVDTYTCIYTCTSMSAHTKAATYMYMYMCIVHNGSTCVCTVQCTRPNWVTEAVPPVHPLLHASLEGSCMGEGITYYI